MDKRLLTVMMAAIVVALVITGIFYQITSGRRASSGPAEKKLLVVAKNELPIGAMLTPDDVRVVEYPAEAYPQGGFENIDDVIDRSITQPILANEPITTGRVTEKGEGFGLAPLIPQGFRAIAIAVNQVSGVSGFIIPGSKVDVLLSATPPDGEEMLTTTVLENVTVLSTGHKQQASADGQPENVPVVNMLLTPDQTEILYLATQEGRIQLVLRNPKDEEETAVDREDKSIHDLFRDAAPKPRPRPAAGPRRPAPAPQIVQVEPPPPAFFQVEMIRGDKREIEEVERSEN